MGDVEVDVYDADLGTTTRRFYTAGAASYLLIRYGEHPKDSGLRWWVTRVTDGNRDGETGECDGEDGLAR